MSRLLLIALLPLTDTQVCLITHRHKTPGASFHMTPNKSFLTSITPLNSTPNILIADGSSLPAVGHRNLTTISDLTKQFSIPYVLHIPKLSLNYSPLVS